MSDSRSRRAGDGHTHLICRRTARALLRLIAAGALVALAAPPAAAQPLAAAVLPGSRSVQVGTPATAFVTVVNAGSATATGVGILIQTLVPAAFSYQTTNPDTNQLTGTLNTPVDILPGGAQTYAIALIPSIAFGPTEVTFSFTGANAPPAPVVVGVNTLLVSASTTLPPDIIALGATIGNTGIVDVPGAPGTGAFGVATANIGATASLTVSADTGSASLPLTTSLCLASLTTGQCLVAPTATVSKVFDAFGIPAFAVFVSATAGIPFDPAGSRIFVRFVDDQGVTRGSTSVAVRTTVPPPAPNP